MLSREEITEDRLRLGPKLKGAYINCLAFADDLVIFANNIDSAINKISRLSEVAEKVGMQIFVEKTNYMTNISDGPDWVDIEYGKIRRFKNFRYLGEVIQQNWLEEEAINVRIRKLDRAYQLTKDMYNKRTMSIGAKFRHYNTVVKTEGLYASETLTMGKQGQVSQLEKRERRILRKILGNRWIDGKVRYRSNEDIYSEIELITGSIKKRRLL